MWRTPPTLSRPRTWRPPRSGCGTRSWRWRKSPYASSAAHGVAPRGGDVRSGADAQRRGAGPWVLVGLDALFCSCRRSRPSWSFGSRPRAGHPLRDVLETRLLQAQTDQLAPIDLVAALVSDELQRREDRLLARRHKQARFRDPDRSLDGFDFAFNKKINRALVFELATARFIAQREGTLPRRSDAPRSSRATASSTAKRTPSSKNSPRPARTTSPSWPARTCSSSTTSACASCPTPLPRTCSS